MATSPETRSSLSGGVSRPPRARAWPVLLLLTLLCAATGRAQDTGRSLIVGEGGSFASVSAALAAAREGDTVRILAGVYREHPVVRIPVTLAGEPGAVIDGEGRGTVLRIEAPVVVRGLTIRRSGSDLSREDAGVLVTQADDVRIEDSRFEDVLFGIYLKQSARPVILRNEIHGAALPLAQRGDGIRLWYCQGGRIEDNRVSSTRDVVIWFSSGVTVERNRVTDGRYGLHYMYSDRNRFYENEFRKNRVGAFIMYSSDIEFRHNRFVEAYGATGIGLGIKDSDDIRAEENVFAGDATGVYLDNSPRSVDARNEFRNNLFLLNDVGVVLLPSVSNNRFEGNAFEWNLTPVAVPGGGDALRNIWRRNHWSEYAGFDEDGNGVGDLPFRHERLADDLYTRRPELRIFALSPAMITVDLLARVFPLLQPTPVVVDSSPLMRPDLPAEVRAAGAVGAKPQGRPAAAGGLMLASIVAGLLMLRLGRRREVLA